jgi:hypothetical protein
MATDEDAMQKAMRRKAERNLDTAGISPSSKAFSSFSSTRISSNMSSVVVFLGSSSFSW